MERRKHNHSFSLKAFRVVYQSSSLLAHLLYLPPIERHFENDILVHNSFKANGLEGSIF
ncbi:hypothetical protein A9HBioS_3379 [Pseudomonas koreensis]|uniref:Uncharacterized protein n=1 Tax=Pseudomonas koreensis TaxID=198620 RepID=A0AA94EMK5_9PSED|nr:hypothetical protein A9HBioS_3379 [Pseudomonas koreensis]